MAVILLIIKDLRQEINHKTAKIEALNVQKATIFGAFCYFFAKFRTI